MYYLRARYYNPTIGRFTQEDVYRGDGLNLYAYVKNNPVMWIDPSGYVKCTKLQSKEVELEWVSDKYTVVEVEGTVKVAGQDQDVSRRVYQIEVNPSYIGDVDGRTNMELMRNGNAPYIDVDGVNQKVELHHLTQSEPGPMVEIGSIKHDEYSSVLHIDTSAGISFRNNSNLSKQYDNFRNNYWKMRAFDIGGAW